MSAAGGLANVFGSGAAQERNAHLASIPEVVGIFSDSGPQTDRDTAPVVRMRHATSMKRHGSVANFGELLSSR